MNVLGVGAVTTWDSGGYTIALPPGTYTVVASGGGLATPLTRTVTVGSGNARLNFGQGDDAFIRKLYQDVLGRTASDAEVGSWLPILQSAGPAPVVR